MTACPVPSPALISIRDAAQLLSVAERTVHSRIKAGAIHSVKIGRRRLVPIAELHRLIASGDRPQQSPATY